MPSPPTLNLIDFPTLSAPKLIFTGAGCTDQLGVTNSTESTPLYNIDTWNKFEILAKDFDEAAPVTDVVSTNTALSSDFLPDSTQLDMP